MCLSLLSKGSWGLTGKALGSSGASLIPPRPSSRALALTREKRTNCPALCGAGQVGNLVPPERGMVGGPCEQLAVVFLWWGAGKASGPLEGRERVQAT